MKLRFLLLPAALALAVPAVAQSQAGDAAAESRLANSTVSLAVDPALNDGRLVLKVAAQNGSSAPIPFGPGNVTIAKLDGQAVALMPLQRLVDDVRTAAGMEVEEVSGSAPTAGSYATAQTSVDSAGMPDVSNVSGTSSISTAETIRQSTRERRKKPTISKADAEQQIAALKQGILQESSLAPGQVAAGQLVTVPLKLGKDDDRTLHIWVKLAGDEHSFTIRAPAR